MSDLVEFVLARIAQDEAALASDKWTDWEDDPAPQRWDYDEMHVGPRRWRRQCEALRRIVAEHSLYDSGLPNVPDMWCCVTCGVDDNAGGLVGEWPCATLRALAGIWLSHPDYDAAWRADDAMGVAWGPDAPARKPLHPLPVCTCAAHDAPPAHPGP